MQHTMQVKSSIHNRFDIEVLDAITGEIKDRLYAENIVLDQMYTRLCGGSAYFAYIAYGTGSGTLAASRTSLFTHKSMKAAVNDATSKALPTSWWRQKIVLNPEDEVGTIITEVGIAYGSASSNLVTHAMLRDMNGNIVSLTKTSLDIITIYATVYVTFSTSNENIEICGMPNNNGLVNYLIGGASFPGGAFYTGEADYTAGQYAPIICSRPVLGTSASLTWTADTANKKRKTNTFRFAVSESNGHIAEIGFGGGLTAPICRLRLPATGIYAGLDLAGVSVGTGDGVAQNFTLPSRNIKQDSIKIKIDGTETASFAKTLLKTINFKWATPILASSGSGGYCALSADGSVLAHAPNNATPCIATYGRIDGTWIKRPTPASVPSEQYPVCALSADGLVLAVGCGTSPYIYVYDWIGGTWIKRANPATLPKTSISAIGLSGNGSVLACTIGGTSPYIYVYDWTGSAWTKRPNPPGLSTYCATVTLSNDGLVLAVGNNSSTIALVYDWTGSAWVKRSDPPSLPSGVGLCSMSANGLVLAVAGTEPPYISTYDWTGSAWTKRPNPATLPIGQCNDTAISPDGLAMVVACASSPYIYVYDWTGSTWVKRANPALLPSAGNDCAVSSNDDFVVFSYDGENMPITYDTKPRQTQITFSTPPGLVTAEAVGVGNGSDTVFSLDYTPVSGLSIYLDGVATTAYTRDGTSITFTAAPGSGVAITADYKYAPVITADYTVNGIHKTAARVIDISAEISFGEGS